MPKQTPPIATVKHDEAGYVLTDPHHVVPRRITATIHHVGGKVRSGAGAAPRPDDWSGGVMVELAIEVDDRAVPRCLGVELKHYEGTPITTEMLRFPLDRLMRYAVAASMVKIETLASGELQRVAVRPGEREDFYEKYRKGARRPQRGSPLSDEHLQRVAQVYRAAVERGDPPTRTVVEQLGGGVVNRATARRWVAAAVDHEFLDKSERLGQRG